MARHRRSSESPVLKWHILPGESKPWRSAKSQREVLASIVLPKSGFTIVFTHNGKDKTGVFHRISHPHGGIVAYYNRAQDEVVVVVRDFSLGIR
jgi:hypothetical protein